MKKIDRRTFIQTGLGLAAGLGVAGVTGTAPTAKDDGVRETHPQLPGRKVHRASSSPQNILFITCDQRMFQPVRAKGFRQPALDRLAARGVTFENHYISSAVCTPSRGVIYSGRAP